MNTIDTLKLALEALESTAHGQDLYDLEEKAITAIKQALAAPVQDECATAYAVGYSNGMTEGYGAGKAAAQSAPYVATPLAAQPAVPLTRQQVIEGFCKTPHQTKYASAFDSGVQFAEAAHGITKGQP